MRVQIVKQQGVGVGVDDGRITYSGGRPFFDKICQSHQAAMDPSPKQTLTFLSKNMTASWPCAKFGSSASQLAAMALRFHGWASAVFCSFSSSLRAQSGKTNEDDEDAEEQALVVAVVDGAAATITSAVTNFLDDPCRRLLLLVLLLPRCVALVDSMTLKVLMVAG